MDVIAAVASPDMARITCVEMHTTGEPARIVIKGYPSLHGTLLEQRAQAKADHDHIRKRIMLEPAGHAYMYGAILRPTTELTESGDAHIGVLFIHGEGYSTMCGHATIALGRFLVDTQDLEVFPQRKKVKCDPSTRTAQVHLHAPCGLVTITVPLTEDLSKSDPTRPVSFISVPSFATGSEIQVDIPQEHRWPQLGQRDNVKVSFCYGGAFTCLVSVHELGLGELGLQQPIDINAFDNATRHLKDVINSDSRYAKYLKHPESNDLSSLYTMMAVDKALGPPAPTSSGAETGLCFFADQQIDRSPTGSVVAARVAYAYAIGELKKGEAWTYHSLVSIAAGGKGGFVGTVVDEAAELYDADAMLGSPVRVKVEGYAYYVGSHVFIAEEEDPFGSSGFLLSRLGSK